MRCLVTGAAGFIGSHLSERLLREGYDVTGLDCFSPYYDTSIKRTNAELLRAYPNFKLVEDNLITADLPPLLRGIDLVFHQAGQPGVRGSWGDGFGEYVLNNIEATQRLLESAKTSGIKKLIYASSSSIYGDVKTLPLREDAAPKPYSPYGVTKLAGEHLCHTYFRNFGLPTVALRYFTVYGPRQRPDMAFNKFIRAGMEGRPIAVYGGGSQTRDFTYVADIVEANLQAALMDGIEGEVFNVGGGSRVTVTETLELIEDALGVPLIRDHQPEQKGDVTHTLSDTTRAKHAFGYEPKVDLKTGLKNEVTWLQSLIAKAA